MSEDAPKVERIKLGDLKAMIEETVAKTVEKVGGNTSGTTTSESSTETGVTSQLDRRKSVADQVREELAKIAEGNKRKQRDEDIDNKIAALTEATKEQEPIERSRVHKIMGWGDDK